MFSKLKTSIILVLACCSIISVGFASWITSNDLTYKYLESDIVVDDVKGRNGCIYLKENTSNCFSFGEKGFVDNNNNYVKNGNISANYVVNLELCSQMFGDFDSLRVILEIGYDNEKVQYNLFDDIISNGKEVFSFKSTIKYQNTDINLTKDNIEKIDSNKNYQYRITIDLVDVLKNYNSNSSTSELAVNYEWRSNDCTYFYKYIFGYLYDGDEKKENIEFVMNASVEGI